MRNGALPDPKRVLLAELGDAYRDYAASTSRLVPHVW